jgi:hypothetical protein
MLLDSVLLRRSDAGEVSLYDERDNFHASFKDGKWQFHCLFTDYELDDFTIIEDETEIARMLAEARAALNCDFSR